MVPQKVPCLAEDTGARCICRYDVPLMELAREVAERGDREALRELHEHRPVFINLNGQSVLMAEFLGELRDCKLAFQWCGRDPVVVDQAYDLTLAKFCESSPVPDSSQADRTPDGPDCRYYYRAFCSHISRDFQQRPPLNGIDAEVRAAGAFQRMVTRHFYLSCLECRRRAAKLVRRYTWKINGDQLVLWLPIEMNGSRCRQWLQQNIPNPDPARPGERDRIQALVDHLLARRRILSLEQLQKTRGSVGAEAAAEPPSWAAEVSVVGLARAVAGEKAENIEDQRPAIRSLGAMRLKDLICTVFEALADERYHAEQIAAKFGLSTASLSRFAGCRWHPDDDHAAAMPDLWRNTAHVLGSRDDFVAVAQQAGVWDRVRRAMGVWDSVNGADK